MNQFHTCVLSVTNDQVTYTGDIWILPAQTPSLVHLDLSSLVHLDLSSLVYLDSLSSKHLNTSSSVDLD